MRYLGKISDPKDLVTKEYVDGSSSGSSAIVGLSAGFIKADGNGGLSSVATIDTASIADDAITADKLGDGSVNSATIANKAVTTEKIAVGAVTGNQIADESITTSKIAQSTVTTEKIVGGAVTADKLANNIPYTKFGLSADQVRGIYIGTETPSNTLGNNGDIYIKYNA